MLEGDAEKEVGPLREGQATVRKYFRSCRELDLPSTLRLLPGAPCRGETEAQREQQSSKNG